MKLSLLFFSFVALLGLQTFAEDDHTPEVCSDKNAKVCGHIGHMKNLKSTSEAEFVAHMSAPDNVQIKDTQISLYMPSMKHGSLPVEIKTMGLNKYKVTKASFAMTGQWEVRIKFKIKDEQHELHIPIQVKE